MMKRRQEWAGPLLVGRNTTKETITRSTDKDAEGPLRILLGLFSAFWHNPNCIFAPYFEKKKTVAVLPSLDV